MQQKIIQVGNSLGVIIPQNILNQTDLKLGENVAIEKRGDQIVLSAAKKKLAKNVDAKFMKMVDEFVKEHEDVLQELARR